jgi:hypothetical protein
MRGQLSPVAPSLLQCGARGNRPLTNDLCRLVTREFTAQHPQSRKSLCSLDSTATSVPPSHVAAEMNYSHGNCEDWRLTSTVGPCGQRTQIPPAWTVVQEHSLKRLHFIPLCCLDCWTVIGQVTGKKGHTTRDVPIRSARAETRLVRERRKNDHATDVTQDGDRNKVARHPLIEVPGLVRPMAAAV